jgi:hypothetical protein
MERGRMTCMHILYLSYTSGHIKGRPGGDACDPRPSKTPDVEASNAL